MSISLRLKITDRCPFNCWFCHNEGSGHRNPTLVGEIFWEAQFAHLIERLQISLSIEEIHLTGGEPSANPYVSELVKNLVSMGFLVKMTTIGCTPAKLRALISAGLHSINFSILAVEPMQFHKTQVDRSITWAREQLARQLKIVELAKELGAEVKINTVLAQSKDIPSTIAVLEWAALRQIPVRVMKELSSGSAAEQAIQELLILLKAKKTGEKHSNSSSNSTALYTLPNGYELAYKQIKDVFLPIICEHCGFRDTKCQERFYGIRLEKRLIQTSWNYIVRLCIHRHDSETVMTVLDFLESEHLKEIKAISTEKG